MRKARDAVDHGRQLAAEFDAETDQLPRHALRAASSSDSPSATSRRGSSQKPAQRLAVDSGAVPTSTRPSASAHRDGDLARVGERLRPRRRGDHCQSGPAGSPRRSRCSRGSGRTAVAAAHTTSAPSSISAWLKSPGRSSGSTRSAACHTQAFPAPSRGSRRLANRRLRARAACWPPQWAFSRRTPGSAPRRGCIGRRRGAPPTSPASRRPVAAPVGPQA